MGHAGEQRFSVTAQVRGRGQADEPAPRDLWVLQVLRLPLPKEANKPDWNAQEWDTLWTPMGLDHPLQASLWNTIEDVLRAERPDLSRPGP